jgi:hypothetical protein
MAKQPPENFHDDIAKRLLADVRARLGGTWDQIDENDRILISELSADAVALQLQAMAATPEQRDALLVERAVIDSSFDDLACVEAARVRDAFWGSVSDVLSWTLGVVLAVA